VAGIAWRAGTLSIAGGLAAWTVGLSVLYGTGWNGGAVLAAFFASSTLISRVSPSPGLRDVDPKGDRRDAWQVYANGGPAGLLALLGSSDPVLRVWLVTASLAAAAADTWATSVGARSRIAPRLLWLGRSVPPGTSGGVTSMGSIGGLAGAALVAGTGALVTARPSLLLAGTLVGFLGMTVDSLLGAALQGRFWCPRCGQASEWKVHRCGARTEWKSGWAWLNNDAVNLLATALAGGIARAVWYWID
jgi:uncharacterized protein (TIGR00297 family)